MVNLQYLGEETKYPVAFKKISEHVVQVTGNVPVKLNGFTLSRIVEDEWKPDYSKYNTVYREVRGGVQYSDDGSVYVAPPKPEPTPEPEPYVPTLEEVKNIKKQEIWEIHNNVVAAGLDIELSTGVEHFPLSDEDQRFLMGKQFELSTGVEELSYQDSNNHCMLLSAIDMQKIITAAMLFVNIQTTYRNNLCEWVDQCDEVEEIQSIVYGVDIPEEYQNEVYKKYISQQEVNLDNEETT